MSKLFTNADLDNVESAELKAQRAEFEKQVAEIEATNNKLKISDALLALIKELNVMEENYCSVGADGKLVPLAEGYEGLAVGINFIGQVFIGNVKNGFPNGLGKTFSYKGELKDIASVNDLKTSSYGHFENSLLKGFGTNIIEANNMEIVSTGNQTENGIDGYCTMEITNILTGETSMSQSGVLKNGVMTEGTICMGAGDSFILQSGSFDQVSNQIKDGVVFMKDNGEFKKIASVKNGEPVMEENVA